MPTFQKAIINHEEKILDIGELSDFSIMQEILNIKDPFDKLWDMAVKFYELHERWMNGPILSVNAEEVEQEVVF